MLDIQPAIECDVNVVNQTIGTGKYIEQLPDYVDVRRLAIIGLTLWAIVFGYFVHGFVFTEEGKFRYMFLSAKMQDHWCVLTVSLRVPATIPKPLCIAASCEPGQVLVGVDIACTQRHDHDVRPFQYEPPGERVVYGQYDHYWVSGASGVRTAVQGQAD
jgi:hypothetical protein|eukprot:COSAG02_NODE_6943_length_3272_cov_12.468704_2_plen_159_part_00